MTTLGEDFPREQERVRELLQAYRDLGPVGQFGAIMIEDVLRRADRAAASGDVVAMIKSYNELRNCQ